MLEIEATDNEDPLIGRVIEGRFRVVKLLGEGGMGKVYLAEQKMGTATRKVAIKTLHTELGDDPQLVARFHRECATVIELQHPNTVKFYDFGELDNGTLFIVMEFIEGEDLAHRLRRGPVSPALADKLLIQICGSLNEAHQRGVVHRDLKPENVLLTDRAGQTDFVKVLDFGIAKRSEAEDKATAKLTKQGMVLGTPPYMSPEQFSGQTLDLRSDIYSLGAMTYEMLTGELPFEANTPWEWATKHLTAPPKSLDAFPQGAALAPNKKAAIMRALAKNRDERQAGVLEFMNEFTGIQDAAAAWTMATSASSGSNRVSDTTGSGAARPPVGTPQPMPSQPGTAPLSGAAQVTGAQGGPPTGPQSMQHSHPAHTPAPAQAYGQHPHSPTPIPGGGPHSNPGVHAPAGYGQFGDTSGSGQFDTSGSGTYAPPTRSGGGSKMVGAAVVLLAILAGVGGTIYVMTDDGTEVANNGEVETPPNNGNTPPNNGTTPPNNRTTPPNNGIDLGAAEPIAAGMTVSTVVEPEVDMNPVSTMTEPEETTTVVTPTTMDEPDEPETTTMMSSTMSSMMTAMRDDTRVRGILARMPSRFNDGNIGQAIALVSQAQRVGGRSHPLVRSARNDIAAWGSNKVQYQISFGQCRQAQALFRQLRTVGAHRRAQRAFNASCSAP